MPCEIPVTLSVDDPGGLASYPCHVILANLRGCAVRSPHPVEAGTVVHLSGLPSSGSVAARVVRCISLGEFEKLWLIALALVDQFGNIWGLEHVPEDWAQV